MENDICGHKSCDTYATCTTEKQGEGYKTACHTPHTVEKIK